MNLEFLPEKILSALDKVNLDNIFEIRLRSLFPVKIKVNSSYCYINEKGLTNSNSGLITVDKDDLMQVVAYVTENSLYAFNDKIKTNSVDILKKSVII